MMKIRIEVDSACPKEEIVFRCSSLSEENVCLYEKLKELARQQETFDIIYADPPYERGFEPKILEWLGDAKIMNPDTILILETSLDTPVDYVDTEQFEIVRIKEYKNNQHVFLRAK